MDRIYSRNRIKIPKITGFDFQRPNPKNKKVVKVMIIFIIAFTTMVLIVSRINPMFNTICKERAKAIATDIINTESSKILKDVNYEDLVKVEKDEQQNIKLLKINTVKINMLASDIAYHIQQELYKAENNQIKMPIGSITGLKYLVGFGPKINIRIYPVGSVITDFNSEFKSAGINQTIHRLYLDVTCKVTIVTPYDKIEADILNQVLMTELVIVGNIPETYYNLEGINTNNAVDIIE